MAQRALEKMSAACERPEMAVAEIQAALFILLSAYNPARIDQTEAKHIVENILRLEILAGRDLKHHLTRQNYDTFRLGNVAAFGRADPDRAYGPIRWIDQDARDELENIVDAQSKTTECGIAVNVPNPYFDVRLIVSDRAPQTERHQ